MAAGRRFPRTIPFVDLLGIRLVDEGEGRSRLELELRPEHTNSWKVAHGGVVMSLLDVTMAVAARTLDAKSVFATTVEMKTSFLASARGTLAAEGHCVQVAPSIAFCESEARDGDGKTVAKASGTFVLRYEK